MVDLTAPKAIIVFLKKPQLGQVKTRIGNVIGHQQALEIYEQLLQMTFEVLDQVDVVKLRYFFPEKFDGHKWPSRDTQDYLQTGDDLGARMQHAFDRAFQHFEKVLIVGTDCPYLTPDILEKAFTALDDHDVVIGPSLDGGYYLLGMKDRLPHLFNHIPWSTDKVLTMTLERLRDKSVFKLPKLSDVDYVEDWEAFLRYSAR